MMAVLTYLRARFASKKGQGLVEYGLIIGIIAVIVVAAFTVLRAPLEGIFEGVKGILTDPDAATTTTP
jgi:pilus assembly protein Flp/PilA